MASDLTNAGTLVLWAAAAYNIGFAIFHLLFWRLFRWPDSLHSSGKLNTAITQTLNIMLIYCFALYGATLIWAAMASITLPHLVLIAGAGFWLFRAALQPLLFSMRTGPSVCMAVVFLAGAGLHTLGALVALN
jgi:hypothetical protein